MSEEYLVCKICGKKLCRIDETSDPGTLMTLMLEHSKREHPNVYQRSVTLFRIYWSQYMHPGPGELGEIFKKMKERENIPYIG